MKKHCSAKDGEGRDFLKLMNWDSFPENIISWYHLIRLSFLKLPLETVNKQCMPALVCISYELMYSEIRPSVNTGEIPMVPAFIWGQQWRVKPQRLWKVQEKTTCSKISFYLTTAGQKYPHQGQSHWWVLIPCLQRTVKNKHGATPDFLCHGWVQPLTHTRNIFMMHLSTDER